MLLGLMAKAETLRHCSAAAAPCRALSWVLTSLGTDICLLACFMEVCFVEERMVVSQVKTWGTAAYVEKWQEVTYRLPLGWPRLLLGSVECFRAVLGKEREVRSWWSPQCRVSSFLRMRVNCGWGQCWNPLDRADDLKC